MPKRKRNAPEGNGDRAFQRQKQDILEELTQSKKLLHRALKTAKGFERQKLGKRLTNATKRGQADEIARINREIEVVKTLDLWRATDAHVHKTLLKIKAFAESELLPEEVRKVLPKPEGGEETMLAVHNVTSGIYNTKPVKDTMGRILSNMYDAMGIPGPVKGEKVKKEKVDTKAAKAEQANMRKEFGQAEVRETKTESSKAPSKKKVSWDGIDSDTELEGDLDAAPEEDEEEDEDDEDGGVSLDEEDLARYGALLGASSDEESFDEAEYLSKRPVKPTARLSLSLSPEPEHQPSLSPSLAPSSSPEPELPQKPKSKPTKAPKSKEPQVKVGGSTFLPTLMGGYWSGSEESASDLEKDAPTPKKNRPGQMARRAIWEKKYGSNASHIKEDKGPVGKGKDDGWDAKRGAKESGGGRGGRGGFGRGGGRVSERATGENAMPLEARGMVKKDRDDVGVLHPSWQAAKKAKEAKKTATFQGKKMTFD